jgi:hypothetical protein
MFHGSRGTYSAVLRNTHGDVTSFEASYAVLEKPARCVQTCKLSGKVGLKLRLRFKLSASFFSYSDKCCEEMQNLNLHKLDIRQSPYTSNPFQTRFLLQQYQQLTP